VSCHLVFAFSWNVFVVGGGGGFVGFGSFLAEWWILEMVD